MCATVRTAMVQSHTRICPCEVRARMGLVRGWGGGGGRTRISTEKYVLVRQENGEKRGTKNYMTRISTDRYDVLR